MEQVLPILYSFRRCPYAMRARLAIAKSGQQVALREVVLRDKPEHMLEISPKGTVPVLLLPDGIVLEESLDVMKWALKENDPDGWLEEMGEDLIMENDTTFKKSLDTYKYFNRHPEHSQEHYREQGEMFLKKLEERLQSQLYLSGNEIKFVDAALLPFVRQFAFVDMEWFQGSEYQGVKRWLNDFLESDLFEKIMPKFEQWKPGDEQIIFP